jgi:hypothetical protein
MDQSQSIAAHTSELSDEARRADFAAIVVGYGDQKDTWVGEYLAAVGEHVVEGLEQRIATAQN